MNQQFVELIKFNEYMLTLLNAEEIVNVQNGFLGWHYVNKIDTCIYYSSGSSFDLGQNKIVWDGKDQLGNSVPVGDYTYYLWGFDHVNPRSLVMGSDIPQFDSGIIENGEDGLPLSNPINYANWWRWSLGSDPVDETLRETTIITPPAGYGTNITPQSISTISTYCTYRFTTKMHQSEVFLNMTGFRTVNRCWISSGVKMAA